jgi:hypothetical protein
MKGITIQPNTTVLVLNSTYEPINLASGKRAIVLLLKEKAQQLSSRVIRLLNYVRIPFSKIVAHRPSKSAIYKRDGNKCQYCGSTRHLTIDHIIPRSKGGGDNWFNLVVACSACNTKKGNKLLEHSGLKLQRQPRAPMNKMQFTLLETNNKEWDQYAVI